MEGDSERIRVGRADETRHTGLHPVILALMHDPELDRALAREPEFFARFMARLSATIDAAFARAEPGALFDVHRTLYLLYEQNFSVPENAQAANQFHPFLVRVRTEIERVWER
ncbi:MAG: hypothetical protein ACREFQ_09895, partial [Stellaceae bacterium]